MHPPSRLLHTVLAATWLPPHRHRGRNEGHGGGGCRGRECATGRPIEPHGPQGPGLMRRSWCSRTERACTS